MHAAPEDIYDLIIVGAGIYGIQAARTYLELHPFRKVLILEASACIGGVWSRERVYREFFTQTPLGILEFSDQPIHHVPREDQQYGFFKAEHVTSYLEDYCRSHKYGGFSIESRIKFQTSVQKMAKSEDGRYWIAHSSGDVKTKAARIIDASGLTSAPKMPRLADQSLFAGRIIHHREFASFEKKLGHSTPRVVVIGGAKSAADVAYSCAKRGHTVTWIVRKTGSGPAAFVSAKGSMGYANSNESFYTRFTSMFLVSLFAQSSGYAKMLRWLQRTSVGQILLRRIWGGINTKAHKIANYDRVDGHENGFRNLKPDTEIFWQNDSTGINQRDDFFDVIAQKVTVLREDIACMSKAGVILCDQHSTCVEADVVICATGWDAHPPYFDAEMAESLGLPVRIDSSSVRGVGTTSLDGLEKASEEDILRQFPILDSVWAHSQAGWKREGYETELPWRLWKSIVPPNDPTIAFVGRVMLGNHFRAAEVQALFACAVLDGNLALPPPHSMYADIAMVLAWCRRRYLKKGRGGNWFYWDLIPYTDMLLETLGLTSHRHEAWHRDLLRPCFAKDLQGLVQEYRTKYARSSSESSRS